jgi:hypothetical protein
VARAAHAEVLHADEPPGCAPITEVLDEFDDKDSDNFRFDNEEDTSGITDEQRALLASMTKLADSSL